MRHRPTLHRSATGSAAAALLVSILAACSSGGMTAASDLAPVTDAPVTSAPSTRPQAARIGQRVPGLDFAVTPGSTPTTASSGPTPAVAPATTAAEARTRFADAVVAGDTATAFGLLTPADRDRFVSAQRFAIELGAEPAWLSATPSDDGSIAVTRTPQLDPVLGLVTPMAIVTLPVVESADRSGISWTRRTVDERATADEALLGPTVTRWATARQACDSAASTDETDNGLVGVVGLATALCGAQGTITVGSAADTLYLLDLDDPAPVLDAYGSAAATWARVVPISAPVPMNVVLAPLGDAWKVIAAVHPTLDQQQQRSAS